MDNCSAVNLFKYVTDERIQTYAISINRLGVNITTKDAFSDESDLPMLLKLYHFNTLLAQEEAKGGSD